jgi:uncharacterized protein (TIGR01777 family)
VEAALVNIAISGSSGLIGRALVPALTSGGHTVVRLVRPQTRRAAPDDVFWNPDAGKIEAERLEGIDAIVHLAGENAESGVWTPARKAAIRDSRVRGAAVLVEAMSRLRCRPGVFVTASSVGVYGDRGADVMTEDCAPGSGFLADVSKDVEAAAGTAIAHGIRVVCARLGAVLSPDGGALSRVLLLARLGFAGPVGNGQQYLSWIAVDDAVDAVRFVLETSGIAGPVNVVAPKPTTNAEFAGALARALGAPTASPLTERAARRLFGERAHELLLPSRRVEPRKLLAYGFRFRYPGLDAAFEAMVDRRPTTAEITGLMDMLPAVAVQWSLGPAAAAEQTVPHDDASLDVWQLRRAYADVAGTRSSEALRPVCETLPHSPARDAVIGWADAIDSLMQRAEREYGAGGSSGAKKRHVAAGLIDWYRGCHIGATAPVDVHRIAAWAVEAMFALAARHDLRHTDEASSFGGKGSINSEAPQLPAVPPAGPHLEPVARWLEAHDGRLIALVNVIAAAAEATEAAESCVGKPAAEKQAHARALVLRFLREERALPDDAVAAATALTDAAIDAVVHVFKKRGHFVAHRAARSIEPAPAPVHSGPERRTTGRPRPEDAEGGVAAAAALLWAEGWARVTDTIADASEEAYRQLEANGYSPLHSKPPRAAAGRDQAVLWRRLGLLLRTGIDTAAGALGSRDARTRGSSHMRSREPRA